MRRCVTDWFHTSGKHCVAEFACNTSIEPLVYGRNLVTAARASQLYFKLDSWDVGVSGPSMT